MGSIKKGEKPDHKKIITGLAIGAVLTMVEVYLSNISGGKSALLWLADLIFGSIRDEGVINLILTVEEIAFLGLSYGVIYYLIYFPYKLIWKLKNKEHYLKGAWLHIHDKEDPKIGVVDIDQEFYDLSVSAKNIRPGSRNHTENQTTWYYIAADFEPEGSMEDKLVGCYLAHRDGERNKYGVHLFKDVKKNEKGYVNHLEGNFGDTFRNEDIRNANGIDRTGKLYLFKMPDCIKKYIEYKNSDSFNKVKLSCIIDDVNSLDDTAKAEEIKNTDFYKTLKKVIQKNNCRKKHRLLTENLDRLDNREVNTQTVDRCLAMILCKVSLCDESLHKNELDNLNHILGTYWNEDYIREVSRSVRYPSCDELGVEEFLSSFKSFNTALWEDLKELVICATKCIIQSDDRRSTEETKCQQMIENLFK
ncbi:MAG: hypothetical protein E7646_01030 [Ruminococcaceae bacterium]|nr:hypothetical protein [Oscillospiraceae bacterium]